jgi:hypothetical protein
MEEILWHRRESRRQTEKTNIFLQPREAPAYSKGGMRVTSYVLRVARSWLLDAGCWILDPLTLWIYPF